jgi:type II secretory pathway component PulJ
VGEKLLLKGEKFEIRTAYQSKKATTSEVDQFDVSNKPSTWCDIELEASQAMAALLKKAPVQSTGWKVTANRLPEPWWQFAHLLFHRDPGLNELLAERDEIIRTFRQHVLLMTHDPVRKNGARALALIDGKPYIEKFGGMLTCRSSYNPGD